MVVVETGDRGSGVTENRAGGFLTVAAPVARSACCEIRTSPDPLPARPLRPPDPSHASSAPREIKDSIHIFLESLFRMGLHSRGLFDLAVVESGAGCSKRSAVTGPLRTGLCESWLARTGPQ